MNPSLLIFDCDGVLVDSEIIVHRIASKEMTKIGFPLTVERSIEIFSGCSVESYLTTVKKEYGRSISSDHLEHIFNKIDDAIKIDLKPIDNIHKVIDHLDQNRIKKCIASNNTYEGVIDSLTFTGIDHYFNKDRIFTVPMVSFGKPKPDLFLHAADRFQVAPQDCIVVEDSVVGIMAAKAAKMPVIGFLGATHAKAPSYLESMVKAKPDIIVNDAFELLSHLGGKIDNTTTV